MEAYADQNTLPCLPPPTLITSADEAEISDSSID